MRLKHRKKQNHNNLRFLLIFLLLLTAVRHFSPLDIGMGYLEDGLMGSRWLSYIT